jgi:hypothetical protein
MANMHQAQGHLLVPTTLARDKLGEFQRTKPPTFSHSVEPMDADDWLKTIEKKLQVVQCNNCEKVLFASHQLDVPLQIGGMLMSKPTRSQKALTGRSLGIASGLLMCHLER